MDTSERTREERKCSQPFPLFQASIIPSINHYLVPLKYTPPPPPTNQTSKTQTHICFALFQASIIPSDGSVV